MINSDLRTVTAIGGGPGLPRVAELARTEVWRGYQRETWTRRPGTVAVQVTLAGQGFLFPESGPPQPIPRGTALVFRTAVDHLTYGLPPGGGHWDFVYANLRGEAALAIAADLIAVGGHILSIDFRHPAVEGLIALDRGRSQGDLRLPAWRSARIACDLLLALGEAMAAGGDDDLAARAMAELEAALPEPQAVATAAARLGVSREHLARSFASATGEPPSAWLRRRRLALAAALLADPGLPLSEVARRCGFAGTSHFVQAFRRERGTTPGRFRRASGGDPARG